MPTESAPKWVWLYFRKRFHDKIRDGVKIRTLRNQRINCGTYVATPVGLIQIVGLAKRTPRDVAGSYWQDEGCDSPEDFLREFESIHPGVSLDKELWLHEFRLRIPAEAP